MAINITRRAADKLLQKGNHILFSCKSGGCNGFEYVFEPVPETPKNVEKQVEPNGLHVYTCNLSMFHLLGTKVDWSEDIMGERFVFDNPNAQSMCGCGSTFSMN